MASCSQSDTDLCAAHSCYFAARPIDATLWYRMSATGERRLKSPATGLFYSTYCSGQQTNQRSILLSLGDGNPPVADEFVESASISRRHHDSTLWRGWMYLAPNSFRDIKLSCHLEAVRWYYWWRSFTPVWLFPFLHLDVIDAALFMDHNFATRWYKNMHITGFARNLVDVRMSTNTRFDYICIYHCVYLYEIGFTQSVRLVH